MNLFDGIILGIIEGITEFLPISSTGHLILANHLLGLSQTEFLKSFEIAIQCGAILSVVALYWKKIAQNPEVIKKIAVAFIPTGILGYIFYKLIKIFLLGNGKVVIWALFVGGVLLILFEFWHKEKEEAVEDLANISYKQSVLIGIFQSIAMVPGVSRSAATILGGLLIGLKRKTIVEFSFLLAVPTMFAATVFDLWKSAGEFSLDQFDVLVVGFIASFIVALLSIKFLLGFIKNHTFVPFGVYRIIAAIIFWFLIF